MPKVIGYTYEADTHCVDCTIAASKRMLVDNNHPYAVPLSSFGKLDENGLHYNLVDSEGNLVHPIFDTDEGNFYCGTCPKEIT